MKAIKTINKFAVLGLFASLALNISFVTDNIGSGSLALASEASLTDELTANDLEGCGLDKTCNVSIKTKVNGEEFTNKLELSFRKVDANSGIDPITGDPIATKEDRIAEGQWTVPGNDCDECARSFRLSQSESWTTKAELLNYLNAEAKRLALKTAKSKKEKEKILADYKKCKSNLDGTKMDKDEKQDCRAERIAEQDAEMEDKLADYALSDDSKDQSKLRDLLDNQLFTRITSLILSGDRAKAEELFEMLKEYNDDPLVAATIKNLITYREANDYRNYMLGQMDQVNRIWQPSEAKKLRLEQLREQMNNQLLQITGGSNNYNYGYQQTTSNSKQQELMQDSLIDGIRPQQNYNRASSDYNGRFSDSNFSNEDAERAIRGSSNYGNYGLYSDVLNYNGGTRGSTTFGGSAPINRQFRSARN